MMAGVRKQQRATVTYIHVLFDQHEIILANGALTESFFPGPVAIDALEAQCRDEVLSLFPELCSYPSNTNQTARFCVTPSEVHLLGDLASCV